MKTKRLFVFLLGAAVLLALSGGAWAATVGTPQASITLTNSDAALCNASQTSWDLTKTAVDNEGNPLIGTTPTITPDDSGNATAIWKVTATKVGVSDTFLTVNGFVSVTNTGGAPATIGNIVVNLQHQKLVNRKTYWISAAADVADATNGDGATSANIVASASQENQVLNVSNGPSNYTVSDRQGTFIETAGSGSLEFTDADNNTIWAITPQQKIAPKATVNLIFEAKFDNTILKISAREQVRAEVIVSFGNAGARGGSGASATNIDINGNTSIDTDEANVRSVPTRITKPVPTAKVCNDSVVLADPTILGDPLAVSGSVTVTGFNSDPAIGDGVIVSATQIFTVTANVSAGDKGGTVTNTAFLTPQECSDCDVQVIIGTYPATGLPIYKTFACCDDISTQASSTVVVQPFGGVVIIPINPGDFTTYSQGGWGAKPSGNNPGTILTNNFASVYPGGSVEVGVPGAGGYSMIFQAGSILVNNGTPHIPIWVSVPVTAVQAIEAYLPGTGTASKLTADLVDPTDSASGVFGGQVLALQLNVDFSAAGITQGPGGPLGNLTYTNIGDSLSGQTISQILAVANTALGGGTLPSGYTYSTLNDLVNNLNLAFDNGGITTWAENHLSK